MRRLAAIVALLALTGCSKEVFVKLTKVDGSLVIELSEKAIFGTKPPCVTAITVSAYDHQFRGFVWRTSTPNDANCHRRRVFRYGEQIDLFQTDGEAQPLQAGMRYRVHVFSTGGGSGSARIKF